jgi:hypothetical protein
VAITSQIEGLDERVLKFLKDTYGATLDGKTIDYRWSPTDRPHGQREQLGEGATHTPQLPTISLSRTTEEFDWTRTLRPGPVKLGYLDESLLQLRTAKAPVPIEVNWQVDIWVEKRRELNFIFEQIATNFRQYQTLSVYIDSVWGDKYMPIWFDSWSDATRLEAGEDHAYRRGVISLRTEFWLFDTVYGSVRTIRDILTELRDQATDTLWRTMVNPPRTVISQGNGAALAFDVVLTRFPISVRTLVVGATVAGVEVRGFDDGAGVITGTGVSGTVNYATGALHLDFDAAPDDTTDLYEEHIAA